MITTIKLTYPSPPIVMVCGGGKHVRTPKIYSHSTFQVIQYC